MKSKKTITKMQTKRYILRPYHDEAVGAHHSA